MCKLALIVDDEGDLIEYLREILETLDDIEIDVIVAENGLEGIQKIEKHIDDLDLVFLDMRMDDVDGITVYNRARELSKDLIIIFMSGLPLAELTEDPNVYFLSKPFTYEDVELTVQKLGI